MAGGFQPPAKASQVRSLSPAQAINLNLIGTKFFSCSIIRHMSKHICKYCQKEFESGPLLGSHVRSHTRKLVECDICHHQFGEKQLEKHRILCLEKEKDRHRLCKKCGKDFSSDCSVFCSRACANKSRVLSEETKEKIRNANLGKTIISRDPRQCRYCGKQTRSIDGQIPKLFCTPRCPESIESLSQKLSQANKGKTGGYREKGGRGKGCHYKGIWLDSTWELALAQRLDELSIQWERDTGKHRFGYVDAEGNERNYYPDFFIPSKDLYIEVKGYWTSETRHKMSSVKERHKHLNLLVLESLDQIQSLTL